jgi:hypothetical protein
MLGHLSWLWKYWVDSGDSTNSSRFPTFVASTSRTCAGVVKKNSLRMQARGSTEERTHETLRNPALTGMSRQQLDTLSTALATLHDTQPGAGMGRPHKLPFPEQVLAAVLHFRLNLPAEPLAVLFGSSRAAMRRTFHKINKLLDQHGSTIPPATSPPAALADLHARVLTLTDSPPPNIKPAC